jgi:hypothetical protein
MARRGYKILIENNSKLIVSRNVTFDEGNHVIAAMGGAKIPSEVKKVIEEEQDNSSDDEEIQWKSIPNPQQAENHPQTPEAKTPETPPQLQKKQSFKSLQHLVQHHNSPSIMNNSAQPKLKRLQRELSIDMAFMAISEFAYVATSTQEIPTTFEDVMRSDQKDEWIQAVQKEQKALDDMGCFGPKQLLPEGFKATNTSYVFVIKSNGQKKARLVYRNNPYTIYGTDDNYSPVVDRTILRIFLHEALSRGWIIEQGDVTNAYINARMDQEVYVKMPKGFYDEKGFVRKLNRALYGHPRSGKLWYEQLANFLGTFGLIQSQREPCMFFSDSCMLIFYVDDFLVARPSISFMDIFFNSFGKQYVIRRMGFPREFLGIQIEYFPEYNAAIIHQQNYIDKLAQKYAVNTNRFPTTPMTPKREQPESEGNENFGFEYSALVGALLFSTVCVRIDISHSTGILTRATQNPEPYNFREALRVLAYLKGTSTYGIVLGGAKPGPQRSLSVYVDADWAGDLHTRKSTAGMVMFCDYSPIDWKSNKIKGTIFSIIN